MVTVSLDFARVTPAATPIEESVIPALTTTFFTPVFGALHFGLGVTGPSAVAA